VTSSFSDTQEPLGENVEQEPANEVDGGKPHQLCPRAIGIVLPAEDGLTVYMGKTLGVFALIMALLALPTTS